MLKPDAINLLIAAKQRILSTPEQFTMEGWYIQQKGKYPENPVHDCGTAACVAGWILALKFPEGIPVGQLLGLTNETMWFSENKEDTQAHEVDDHASKVLDIPYEEAQRLFRLYNWPRHYRVMYDQAETPEVRAQSAALRIDHFIVSNGKE